MYVWIWLQCNFPNYENYKNIPKIYEQITCEFNRKADNSLKMFFKPAVPKLNWTFFSKSSSELEYFVMDYALTKIKSTLKRKGSAFIL